MKTLKKPINTQTAILALIFSFLSACDQAPKREVEGVPYKPSDYIMTRTFTIAQEMIDTINPFLIAKGKGDDWFFYLYAYKIRFLYNNRKDSFVDRAYFEWDIRNKTTLNQMTYGTKEDNFNFQLDPYYEPESELNDSSQIRRITIRLGKKTFQGVATGTR